MQQPAPRRRASILLAPADNAAQCPCSNAQCSDCVLHARARSCSPVATLSHGCICGPLSPPSKTVELRLVVDAASGGGVAQCSGCKGVLRS